MIGSIVINSQSAVQTLYCFSDHDLDQDNSSMSSGNHIHGKYNGKWWMNSEGYNQKIVDIPSMFKTIHVSTNDDQNDWQSLLSNVDSMSGHRVIDKYNTLMKTLDKSKPWVSVMNTTIQTINDSIGSLNIMWNKTPMFFYGLVDEKTNIQFVFSDHDISHEIKVRYPMKYLCYRFQIYNQGTMFFNTKTLCWKWWQWSQAVDNSKLKSFSALEHLLLKHLD